MNEKNNHPRTVSSKIGLSVLTHIANLFFEDCKLYEIIEDPDLSVRFQYKMENNRVLHC